MILIVLLFLYWFGLFVCLCFLLLVIYVWGDVMWLFRLLFIMIVLDLLISLALCG